MEIRDINGLYVLQWAGEQGWGPGSFGCRGADENGKGQRALLPSELSENTSAYILRFT